MIDWTLVYEKMEDAKAIAFDTCHKIYVLMDDAQVQLMREYEYDPIITKDEMSAGEMFETLKHWYSESCGLKFISAVSTVAEGEDPNEGFETLIEQGATETDECYECGEEYCEGECLDEERCERCGDDDVYEDYLCRDCWDDNQEEEDE
jgi:hypothetical protein